MQENGDYRVAVTTLSMMWKWFSGHHFHKCKPTVTTKLPCYDTLLDSLQYSRGFYRRYWNIYHVVQKKINHCKFYANISAATGSFGLKFSDIIIKHVSCSSC